MLFFHEDSGKIQLIDMQKIRAVRKRQSSSIAPGVSAEPHQDKDTSQTEKKSSRSSGAGVFYRR